MAKRNFSRPYRKQTGYPSYIIVSDGETEKWYFQQMKDVEGLRSYIAYKSNLKGSLEDIYSKIVEVLGDEYTQVFWIIDYDALIKEEREFRGDGIRPLQRLKNIVKEVAKKYQQELQIVFNNPCLEYWYLLHYKQTSKYYQKYDGDLKRDLLSYIPSYEKTQKFYKGKNLYLTLKEKQSAAILNAKELSPFDLNDTEHACADIYKVVEFLLDTITHQQ